MRIKRRASSRTDRLEGPGGPGRLPAQGSHRPVRAQLRHTVPPVKSLATATVHGVYDAGWDQRMTGHQLLEQIPVESPFPVAASVSGGLDSSSIFCVGQRLLREEGPICPSLVGITHASPPGSSAYELEYIAAIERDYGVSIQRLPVEFRIPNES